MLIISIFLTMVIMVGFNKFLVGLLCNSSRFQDKKHWFGIRKKDIPEVNLKETPKVVDFWDKYNFTKIFKPYNKGFGIFCAFMVPECEGLWFQSMRGTETEPCSLGS